ncbi:MAG: signal peptidase I [Patescibacteria group bacterium]
MPIIKSENEFNEELQQGGGGKRKLSFASTALEYFAEFTKIFIIAAAIILPVRLFLVQPFYVRGQSMEPNFHDSEYLIIDKLSPRFKPYQRGEVIVFRYDSADQRYLIKRIIGLPGEHVSIANRHVTITNKEHPDGLTLDENTYKPQELGLETLEFDVAPDEYFVLGDNRENSYDSSKFGPIKIRQVIGRVYLRGLPITKFEIFSAPTY